MSNTIAIGQTFPVRKAPLLPSNVMGMGVFVLTEIMFFTALVSAYVVIKAGAGAWAPPGSAMLPVATTAANTAVLLLSGVLFFLAGRALRNPQTQGRAQNLYLQSLILGGIFVSVQGWEWSHLLGMGMNMQTNIFSACFYLLIGSHALHALGAIVALAWFYFKKVRKGTLSVSEMTTLQMFWFFVVGVWPVLYGLVYF